MTVARDGRGAPTGRDRLVQGGFGRHRRQHRELSALAAQDLASSLRPYMRTHYVQSNVGHYGVFSGKRWQRHIYPLIRNVIHVSA